MKLHVPKMSKSNLLFALAFLLAIGLGYQVQGALTRTRHQQTMQVVALKQNVSLEPYQVIQAADVEMKAIDRGSVQPDTLVSLQDAVGKRSVSKLLPGTVLRKGVLLQGDSLIGVLASLGVDTLVADTVAVDPEQSQLAAVGDWITLHGIIRQGANSALLSIRKVPVLAKNEQGLTVAITAKQADALDQVVLNGGKIRIVLNQP